MANRHKAYAKGGHVMRRMEHDEQEAKEAGLKRGGKAHHHKGGGKVHGHKGHHRLDKRARGGGVGADKHPFSSAFRSSDERVRSGHSGK
jgi:hypothetical protein